MFAQYQTFDNFIKAAGDIRTSADAVQYSEDDHPVYLFSIGERRSRQAIFANPSVIGFAFFTPEYFLRLLYAPYYSVEEDGDAFMHGHMGDNILAHSTVRILDDPESEKVDRQLLLGNVVVPIPGTVIQLAADQGLPGYVGRLMKKEDAAFTTSGPSSHMVQIPVVLPLVPHHPLIEGEITDARVQAALRSYGKIPTIFLEAGIWLRACPNKLVTPANKKSTYGGKRSQKPLPKDFEESLLNTTLSLKVEPVNRPDENDVSSPAGIVRAKVVSIRGFEFSQIQGCRSATTAY